MAFAAAGGVGVVFDLRDAAVVAQSLGVSIRTNVVRAASPKAFAGGRRNRSLDDPL